MHVRPGGLLALSPAATGSAIPSAVMIRQAGMPSAAARPMIAASSSLKATEAPEATGAVPFVGHRRGSAGDMRELAS